MKRLKSLAFFFCYRRSTEGKLQEWQSASFSSLPLFTTNPSVVSWASKPFCNGSNTDAAAAPISDISPPWRKVRHSEFQTLFFTQLAPSFHRCTSREWSRSWFGIFAVSSFYFCRVSALRCLSRSGPMLPLRHVNPRRCDAELHLMESDVRRLIVRL